MDDLKDIGQEDFLKNLQAFKLLIWLYEQSEGYEDDDEYIINILINRTIKLFLIATSWTDDI